MWTQDLSRPRVGQKGNRVPYRRQQILELEKEFLYNPYPERLRRMDIAKALQLTDRQVKIWFQNRRMKEKRLKNMNSEMNSDRASNSSPLNYSLSNNNHSN
ncbi:Homeobox protein Hox-C9 [Homalodisca vitripennis]|nr:Homeobox protein Hox-C9 [Homalodisca vitripennis]